MVSPSDTAAVVVEPALDVGPLVLEETSAVEEPVVVMAPLLDVPGDTDDWQPTKSTPASSTATIPPTQ